MLDATTINDDLTFRKLLNDYIIKNNKDPEFVVINKNLEQLEKFNIANKQIYGINYKTI